MFDAFELLLRARPEAWAEAWLLLRRKFDLALHLLPSEGGEPTELWFERRTRDLARRCLSMLSPWTVVQGIDRIGAEIDSQLFAQLDEYRPLGLLLVSKTPC